MFSQKDKAILDAGIVLYEYLFGEEFLPEFFALDLNIFK